MRRYFSWLPNFITLINLFSGSCAIVELFNERYNNVILFVIISLIADFLDGLIARALKAQSIIGKDLDSLADLISFGLLPSFILYHLAEQQEYSLWNYLCFSVVIFSALRLARFNHDTRQTYHFVGLPTPANALLTSSLLLFLIFEQPEISEHNIFLKWNSIIFSNIIYSTKMLRVWALLSSLFLILPVNLLSLKAPKYKISEIKHQLIFITGSILIFILFGHMSVFWIMIWYLIWSIIWYYIIL
ncbi:MAG: CDP-diacylglycerol--serine O-phosphatidyltransferase [Bacteroidia bacterium]|nr:MAG: CDP-diacylglycerol--serine O-phosphatidyltransferase [Bacteroidia bacterium]